MDHLQLHLIISYPVPAGTFIGHHLWIRYATRILFRANERPVQLAAARTSKTYRIFKGILSSGNLKRNINNILSFVEHKIIDLSSLPVHVLRRLCCFKKLNPQSLLIASELPRASIPTAPFLYLNRKKL